MISSFAIWLEVMDDIEYAILGVVGGGSHLNDAERAHLLNRRTTEFGSDILDKLRNLGIVKKAGETNLQRYSSIVRAIDRGVSVKELINLISGQVIESKGYPSDLPINESKALFNEWVDAIQKRNGPLSTVGLMRLKLNFKQTPLPLIYYMVNR